jgi:hypothetical protein
MIRSEQQAWGRVGALRLHAKHGADTAQKARKAFMSRFVPTDPSLSDEEREERASFARRAYFNELAIRSAAARRARKAHGDRGATVRPATPRDEVSR